MYQLATQKYTPNAPSSLTRKVAVAYGCYKPQFTTFKPEAFGF